MIQRCQLLPSLLWRGHKAHTMSLPPHSKGMTHRRCRSSRSTGRGGKQRQRLAADETMNATRWVSRPAATASSRVTIFSPNDGDASAFFPFGLLQICHFPLLRQGRTCVSVPQREPETAPHVLCGCPCRERLLLVEVALAGTVFRSPAGLGGT